MPKEIALQLESRCDSAETIADILRRHPKTSIDNVIIDALLRLGADNKVYSEIAVKAKQAITNSKQRYVTIHKGMIQ